jgi:hypothetical protein
MDSSFARQLAEARLNADCDYKAVMEELKLIAEEMCVELKFTDCSDLRVQLENAIIAHEIHEAAGMVQKEHTMRQPYYCAKKNVVFGIGCK